LIKEVSVPVVNYETRDKIAFITLNRPEVMNSLNSDADERLWQALCDFRDNPDIRVCIITGAGEKAFCAGHDLSETDASGKFKIPPTMPASGFGGITRAFECYKPIIAAVNGYALGGGFEITLSCDIIIAAENARFGLPEPTIGAIAGASGIHRLARSIPLKIAMSMILTGRHITAQEAFRAGLVNEIIPLKNLIARAEEWARDIVRCAPLAVQASKEAVMKNLGLPLEAAMKNSYHLDEMVKNSQDFKEGARAFNEKRQPRWEGK
jgi:enoyl-CoA hydratase/carnithine racemase